MSEPTIAEIVERYLRHAEASGLFCPESLSQRRQTFTLFCQAYGTYKITDCKAFFLSDWIEAQPGWRSSSSKKARANQVNACMNWAVDQDRIVKNPFRKINYPEADPRPPMEDEALNEICYEGNKRYERAVKFLRFTGCRVGELCRMTWQDVDLDKAFVKLQKHKSRKKTGRPRLFALLPEAVELLRQIRQGQKAEYQGVVFLNTKRRPWNRRTMGQQLRRMKDRGEVKTVAGLHGIRHAFGSQAIRNGASLKSVSLQMGHSNSIITERYYCHLDNDIGFMCLAAQFALPQKEIGS